MEVFSFEFYNLDLLERLAYNCGDLDLQMTKLTFWIIY